MNKNILKLSTLVTIWAFCSQNATAQQGFGTNQPSKASVIEMKSGTKGLLIPRVALTDLNNFGPIIGNTGITPTETNSLMVYNTTTDTTANLSAGYYYWTATDTNDGTIGHWQRFMTGTDEAALALDGDVTGALNNTTVGKIQGRNVANTAPTSNQVLTWNGTAWTPTSLTPAQITDAQNVTAGSNKVTLGGTPVGASLQPFSIDVAEANLTLSNMGGKVTNNQITPGTGGQVLVTSADGSTTNWVEQFDIVPATTNTLSSAANSMTSNVNGVSSSANIINSNTLVLTGDNLESTVNGVATTPAVDLSKYLDNTDEQEITNFSVTGGNLSITIENGNTMTVPLSSIDTDNQTITDLSLNGTQLSITLERGGAPVTVDLTALTNTTNLGNGTNTTVLGDGSSTTPYTVNVATGNGTTLGVVRQADTAPSVTVTNGVLAVDPANVAITNALTSSGNQMSSTVNGGTAQTASIINTNELSLDTDNHLISTINGVPSSALDLSAAVQAAETLTSITQDATSGVITYERERDTIQTANVVNATSDNLISYDAGAFLNATTIQNNQLNTVVAQGTGITVTPTTSGNTTTYTVAANPVDAADLTNKGTLSVSGGLEFTGSSNGTDKLLANAGIGVANGGINNVKLANNAVSAIKIEDGAVTASKVNADVAGIGLTKNTTTGALDVDMAAVETELADGTISATNGAITVTDGANATFKDVTLAVNIESGLEIHDDKVKLGGNLTRETTITQDGNAFTIATGGSNLNISGLDKTKVQATDATAGITDRLLAVDGNDKVKALKAAMPKFFYMPSVMVPTAESHLGQAGVTFDNATRTGTINLYSIYTAQFGSPVASTNASALPVLRITDLDFHVTYATPGVFTISGIDATTGVMTYTVNANADITNGSFINIVFSVKED